MSEKIAKFLEKAAGYDGKTHTQHWLNCAALSSENTMIAHAYAWMAQRACKPFQFSIHPCCRWASSGDEIPNWYYGALSGDVFHHLASGAYMVCYESAARAYFALAGALVYCMDQDDMEEAEAYLKRIRAEYAGKDLTVGL